MSAIPPYIRVSVVAKACGRPLRPVRRQLDRAGILERDGHLFVVGDSRLRERLPELYDRVFSYYADRADASRQTGPL